jgi:hypothetical protein
MNPVNTFGDQPGELRTDRQPIAVLHDLPGLRSHYRGQPALRGPGRLLALLRARRIPVLVAPGRAERENRMCDRCTGRQGVSTKSEKEAQAA